MLSKNCIQCKESFAKPYTCGIPEWTRRSFCSRDCVNKFQKGKSLKNVDNRGKIPWNKGLHPEYLQGKNHHNWKKKIKKVCPVCGKTFLVRPSLDRVIHCSKKCSFVSRRDFVPWNKGLALMNCLYCGKGFSRKRKRQKFCSLKCSGQGKRSKNHWNWKGGKVKIGRQKVLNYKEYRQYRDWQKAVFERDNYACQICDKHGGELHADHIKQYALYPKLRWVLSNGRTLCALCHRKTPTYGKKTSML